MCNQQLPLLKEWVIKYDDRSSSEWSHEKSTAFIRYITDTTFVPLIQQASPYQSSHTVSQAQTTWMCLHQTHWSEHRHTEYSSGIHVSRRTLSTAGWAPDKGCIEKQVSTATGASVITWWDLRWSRGPERKEFGFQQWLKFHLCQKQKLISQWIKSGPILLIRCVS